MEGGSLLVRERRSIDGGIRSTQMEAVPSEAMSPHVGGLPWEADGSAPVALPRSDRRVRARVRDRDSLYPVLLADLVAVVVATVASAESLGTDELKPAALLVIPAALIAVKILGLYERDGLILRKTALGDVPALFKIATLLTLSFWLLEDVFVRGQFEHGQIIVFWTGLFGIGVLGRAVARVAGGRIVDPERCLVIGDMALAEALRSKLADTTGGRATVVGVASLGEGHETSLVGKADDVRSLVDDSGADRVIVAARELDTVQLIELIRVLRSLEVRLSVLPPVPELVGRCIELDELQGMPILGVRRMELSWSSRLAKRALDLIGSTLGLLVTAPFIAAVAVAIKLDSPGPVFFWQTRVGKDGRLFKIVKFRTMVNGADAKKQELRDRNEADGLFKIAEDPRVTRVGRWLRHTSLDELPQLWNVLRGEMSLVGPRPFVEEDDRQIQGWHRRRLELTPGMTGHWQVVGASKIGFGEMVEIDYLYVANWSLWLDLKLLLRTVRHVLRRGNV
jgi:exopolysaccharide biosynthesis polyprenyl glycosylphosphotransferase